MAGMKICSFSWQWLPNAMVKMPCTFRQFSLSPLPELKPLFMPLSRVDRKIYTFIIFVIKDVHWQGCAYLIVTCETHCMLTQENTIWFFLMKAIIHYLDTIFNKYLSGLLRFYISICALEDLPLFDWSQDHKRRSLQAESPDNLRGYTTHRYS